MAELDLKEKNHRLSLNLMDYPQNCFEKIFNLMKNNINSEEYEEEIKQAEKNFKTLIT